MVMRAIGQGIERFGAAAAIAGPALYGVVYCLLGLWTDFGIVAFKPLEDNHWLFHLIDSPVLAIWTIGILALHRRQLRRAGKFGRIAAYLTIWGTASGALGALPILVVEIGFGLRTAEGVLDVIAHLPSFMPLMFGSLVFGIATLRARVLPVGGAATLLLASVANFALGFTGTTGVPRIAVLFLFALAWVWLGTALPGERRAATALPALASGD